MQLLSLIEKEYLTNYFYLMSLFPVCLLQSSVAIAYGPQLLRRGAAKLMMRFTINHVKVQASYYDLGPLSI